MRDCSSLSATDLCVYTKRPNGQLVLQFSRIGGNGSILIFCCVATKGAQVAGCDQWANSSQLHSQEFLKSIDPSRNRFDPQEFLKISLWIHRFQSFHPAELLTCWNLALKKFHHCSTGMRGRRGRISNAIA